LVGMRDRHCRAPANEGPGKRHKRETTLSVQEGGRVGVHLGGAATNKKTRDKGKGKVSPRSGVKSGHEPPLNHREEEEKRIQ